MTKRRKQILIILLNIFFGGFGTILFPFISGEYFEFRFIFLGILIGLIQSIHFVNILSIITGFKFIIHLYDIIAGDNVFKPFMSDNYQTFLNMTEEVSENLPDINDSNEIIIDPKEILEKNSRIILIKIILLIISGFSYINGSIIPFLNFLKGDEITFRMLSNGIINPVGGIFNSSVLYFNKDYKMFIISLIGTILGILLMFCPYILGLGIYLITIIKSVTNLLLFKIIFICIGISGTVFNLVFNILQNKLEKEENEDDKINMFDINCIICSEHYELKSHFGYSSIIRIIFNIIMPGSGIFSLLCKYGFTIGIFFTGIVILFSGIAFLIFIIYILLNKTYEDDDIIFFVFFTGTLLLHLAGIIIIIISDYFPEMPERYNGLAIFALTLLNLISGGLGNLIIIDNSYNCTCKDEIGNCIAIFVKILWSIIGICLQEIIIYTMFIKKPVRWKILFSIFFVLYFILSFIFLCVIKDKIKTKRVRQVIVSTQGNYINSVGSNALQERDHYSNAYRERRNYSEIPQMYMYPHYVYGENIHHPEVDRINIYSPNNVLNYNFNK